MRTYLVGFVIESVMTALPVRHFVQVTDTDTAAVEWNFANVRPGATIVSIVEL